MEEDAGGRIFFSTRGRRLVMEDEIRLTSVGVDIGSSTSHLVFSEIVLERLDARYVVSQRKALYQSDILLTPYFDDETIDDRALAGFVEDQYERSGLTPAAIDTGALVLTGVAVRRKNARAIADLFAREAGKFVAVSAGDSLETIMAAYGSGAVARSSRDSSCVVNVDIGGGTSKIAVCRGGEIVDRTAADIGARIVAFDADRRIRRIEVAGRWFGERLGRKLRLGDQLPPDFAAAMAEDMADLLLAILQGRASEGGAEPLLRLEPLGVHHPDAVTISGGVAEYAYCESQACFGDLGTLLAAAFVRRLARQSLPLKRPDELIRATVIGAAQYTAQVSGGTIFVSPLDILPLRNVPVIAPAFPLEEKIDPVSVAHATIDALRFMELDHAETPVAIFVPWRGSASFARLDAFCRGLLDALEPVISMGRPLVLVGDHDVGGLIGIHLRHELGFQAPLASIDGLELKSFDYVDIGEMLEASGAVPVVIKSLVFPADARIGRS